MSKTPLRAYLDRIGQSAESFAAEKGFSPWSVRHWARGDKVPELANQVAIAAATDGEIPPESWLSWSIERSSRPTKPSERAA